LSKLKEKLVASDATIFHVKFPAEYSESDSPFAMPVTECLNGFISSDYPEDEYSGQFSAFRAKSNELANSKHKGITGGWSVESHQHESLGEGVDGKLFTIFIGWPNVEAHMEFRKTEDFAKTTGLLREGIKGMKVWHVAFQQYK
jgi:hypothetical protein